MVQSSAEIVLRRWFPQFAATAIAPLGNAGGFSGAEIWRVTSSCGDFALRRWPAESGPKKIAAIHDFLRHLRQSQFTLCPLPQNSASGESLVKHDSWLWEVTSWQPGSPKDAATVSDAEIAVAMRSLAKFHLVAAKYRTGESQGFPPGLTARCERIQRVLETNQLVQLAAARIEPLWQGLGEIRADLLSVFETTARRCLPEIFAATKFTTPLQLCLRDIWSAHVLFTGGEVTGILDFDAMRIDTIATDIARLLVSYAADDSYRWQLWLAAYESVRPLNPMERTLVQRHDESAVLLTGLQWLEWILLERRTFPDPAAVLARLDVTRRRLLHLSNASNRKWDRG